MLLVSASIVCDRPPLASLSVRGTRCAGADLQCLGIDRRAASMGVGAGERQRAGTELGQAAARRCQRARKRHVRYAW